MKKIKNLFKSVWEAMCPQYPSMTEINVNWGRISDSLLMIRLTGLVLCQVIEEQQIVIEQLRKEKNNGN